MKQHSKFLFVILLLISLVSRAQMSDSLANYYYYINQAELLIADNNYAGADKKYDRAASFKSNWYGKDYYNYALVQLKLNEFKKVQTPLERLISKGFALDSLFTIKTFENYFTSKKGQKLLLKLKEVKPAYNTELRAVYDSLYEVDRLASKRYKHNIYNDSIAKIDSSNIVLLDQLLKEYGFPSEDLIGIHGWFAYQPVFDLMIHHSSHRQIGPVYDYVSFINESGYEGLIYNQKAAYLITRISSYDQYNFDGVIYKVVVEESLSDKAGKNVYTDSIYLYMKGAGAEEVQEERQQLSLPLMKDELKLSKFIWENKTEFILGSNQRQIGLVPNRNALKSIEEFGVIVEIDEK